MWTREIQFGREAILLQQWTEDAEVAVGPEVVRTRLKDKVS